MSQKLEFFYDYVSSYSYLANSQLRGIDADVVYRPMFLGALMQATGNRPPASVPARGEYLRKDLARWAERYGVGFRMNPVFPQNTLVALRLALVAQDEGTFESLHQPLFDAMWTEGRDLGDDAVLAGILRDADLDADRMLAASNAGEIKDRLKANTQEAERRGAFGAPTIFIGDEMFFGNDRLDFVREALRDD